MTKFLASAAAACFASAAISSHAQVVVWDIDFDSSTPGDTSGNNTPLPGIEFETANSGSSIVVDVSTVTELAGTSFSGNAALLSTGDNGFTAFRPDANPLALPGSFDPSTEYTFTLDVFILGTTDLTTPIGDFQPRFGNNGGPTDTSGAVSAPGFHSISYTGLISDFGVAAAVDVIRPFVGFNQGAGAAGFAVADFVYVDNIRLTLVPEPASLALLGLAAPMVIGRRRKK